MTLTLQASAPGVSARLDTASQDGSISPVEFQAIRDDADRIFGKLPAMAEYKKTVALPQAVTEFQRLSDALVEAMQQIALGARRAKVPDAEKAQLKEAVEAQLAYVVLGYKSSVERL